MARRGSSRRWLKEHFDDEYVQRAQKEGYRSRAVYKLIELDQRYKIFRPGMTVVDLGAAPGGWSQYASLQVGMQGIVIATDILKMDAIPGVDFVQGDFQEDTVIDHIVAALGNKKVDLVISDIAPNMSGNDAIDIPRSMCLIELAADMACKILKKDGGFVCKLFQGQGVEQWLNTMRQHFQKVRIKKPKASRPRSREVYVIASGFRCVAETG